MYKPYTVKYKFCPEIVYEDGTIVQKCLPLSFARARSDAALLNVGFINGIIKACTIIETNEESKKVFEVLHES